MLMDIGYFHLDLICMSTLDIDVFCLEISSNKSFRQRPFHRDYTSKNINCLMSEKRMIVSH